MTAPTKPVNPYARLFEEFKKFLGSVRHPKRTKMAWWGSASVGNMAERDALLAAKELE